MFYVIQWKQELFDGELMLKRITKDMHDNSFSAYIDFQGKPFSFVFIITWAYVVLWIKYTEFLWVYNW